jgi:Zn-dependent protease/CBS domain-containing protein
MTRPLRLGRIFGLSIELDYTWFLIFAVVALLVATGSLPAERPELRAPARLLIGFFTAALFFASVLAHEISHSLVARRHGLEISGITLFIFGGVAKLGAEPKSPRAELLIAASGPATSLLLAAPFHGLHLFLLSRLPVLAVVCQLLARANLALAIFNLIPGLPLDGGRLLKALLWWRWGDLRKATQVASLAGQGLGVSLIALGLLAAVSGLFGGLWFAFIGVFLLQAAQSSYRQLLLRQSLAGIRVADIMTPRVATLPAGTRLEELFSDPFLTLNFSALPVLDGERVVGLLRLAEARALPRARWGSTTVGEAVAPLRPEQVISPREEAWEALIRIMGSGEGRLLVIENGRLEGILSRSDLMELLRRRLDLGR